MAAFLSPWQQHIQLTKRDLRVYTINMQSFTTTHSQRNAQCLSECDSPVCVQTSLDSLKPAVLRHIGNAVQKGLKEGFHCNISLLIVLELISVVQLTLGEGCLMTYHLSSVITLFGFFKFFFLNPTLYLKSMMFLCLTVHPHLWF